MITFSPPQEGIRQVEHTADVWLEASGDSIEEVISRMVQGIYGVMAGIFEIGMEKEERELRVKGNELETAMVDLLSELLFLFDAERYVFTDTEVGIEEGRDLGFEIVLRGKGGAGSVMEGEGGVEVKAVTYHGASIEDEMGKIKARVLLDI